MGKEIMEDVSRWMESHLTDVTSTPAIHRGVAEPFRQLNEKIQMASM
jgi:hypothetical protein